MRFAWSAAALGLGLIAGCAAAPGVVVKSGGPLPSGVFVAQYAYGSGDIGGGHGTFLSLFSERSGKHLRDLVHIEVGAMEEGSGVSLAGYSRGADGSITYALARGPFYTSNVAGGAPRPGSCGGTVYRLDARTGRIRSLFTVGRNWTVSSPSVRPDGKSVAYLSMPCTAAFAQRVVVRDLATGHERDIFVPQASVGSVGWRGDGAQLVFTVAFMNPVGVRGYVVVPADANGSQAPSAVHQAPDRGCVVKAAVFAQAGVQLAEGCPSAWTGLALLVQFAGAGPRVAWRADTGLCANEMTLAHDPSGHLLVTSTTTCEDPGAPVDVVQSWTGQHWQEPGRYVNPQQFVAAAA